MHSNIPTPWHINHFDGTQVIARIERKEPIIICHMAGKFGEHLDAARLIVRAVNAHDLLIVTIKRLLAQRVRRAATDNEWLAAEQSAISALDQALIDSL